MLPTAAKLFERLPRFLRRHRLMKGWLRVTGEDPLQLVRIRDDTFGYADMRNGFMRLIVIEDDFEKEFFSIADAFLERGGVFIDVGANHGLLTTRVGRSSWPKSTISCFRAEPHACVLN